MIRAVVALVLAVLLAPAAASAAPIDTFAGEWRGVVLEEQADQGLEESDLDLTIAPHNGGFSLTWTSVAPTADGGIDKRRIIARFAPTARPGVFAYDDKQTSLLGRFFASPETGNPLEGETLLWGRIEEALLVVYGLSLDDDGGFELQRAEIVPAGDGLALERTLRRGHERTVLLSGRLERAEGGR